MVTLDTPTTPDEFREDLEQMRARSSSAKVLRRSSRQLLDAAREASMPPYRRSAKYLAYRGPRRCRRTCQPKVLLSARSIRVIAKLSVTTSMGPMVRLGRFRHLSKRSLSR